MLLSQYSNPQCTPWSGLSTLRRFQNDVERLFGTTTPAERTWLPSLEVSEAADSFLVAVELPGVKAADVKVTLEDDVLTISGERKHDGAGNTELRVSERFYGKFERTIHLPAAVQADKVTAASRDGILTITLPKTEEVRPREIKIAVS